MAQHLNIAGIGDVIWYTQDEYGTVRHLKISALYVPNAKQRLLSTTVLRNLTEEKMTIESDQLLLHGEAGLENRGPAKAKNNPLNNLPTSISGSRSHGLGSQWSVTRAKIRKGTN
jgi:hypothetical protein